MINNPNGRRRANEQFAVETPHVARYCFKGGFEFTSAAGLCEGCDFIISVMFKARSTPATQIINSLTVYYRKWP